MLSGASWVPCRRDRDSWQASRGRAVFDRATARADGRFTSRSGCRVVCALTTRNGLSFIVIESPASQTGRPK